MNKYILDAEFRRDLAQEQLDEVIKRVQSECPHNDIVEGNSVQYFIAYPPFAVCKDCGYAEEGWGCGYDKLGWRNGKKPVRVDRDEARKFIRGTMKRQERDYD